MLLKRGADIITADSTNYPTYPAHCQLLPAASTTVLAVGATGIVSGLLAPSAMTQTGEK